MGRHYLDVAILFGLLGLTCVFYKKIKSTIKWVALGLIILSICSVFDANKPFNPVREPSAFSNEYCPCYDVFRSMHYGTNKNVMVFVLDATPADIATQIFKLDATLRDKFRGFVDFKQNIGVGEKTIRGVPTIATGKILEKEDDPHDFLYSFWGADSFLNAYLKADYRMHVAPALFGFGYTNSRQFFSEIKSCDNEKMHPFRRYTREAPFLTFVDVLKIRLSFYRYKLSVIVKAMSEGNRNMTFGQQNLGRENVFFERLRDFPIDSTNKTFMLYHLPGVHFPILYGRHGEPLKNCISDGLLLKKGHDEKVCSVIRDYLHYILENIGSYFDWLRMNNLYDSTMIVITTDHGIVNRPKSALLLVKPLHAKDEFKISDAPTSHERIASMMRSAALQDLSYEELKAVLSMDVRRIRIRQPTPEKWWQFGRFIDTYEIKYDSSGKELSRENMGEFKVL